MCACCRTQRLCRRKGRDPSTLNEGLSAPHVWISFRETALLRRRFLDHGVNGWGVDFDDAVEAKAALGRIADGGVDEESLLRRIPGLPVLGCVWGYNI